MHLAGTEQELKQSSLSRAVRDITTILVVEGHPALLLVAITAVVVADRLVAGAQQILEQ